MDGEAAAVLLAAEGRRLLAIDHRLQLEHRGELGAVLAEVETEKADNRFNECRSGPDGRLWAGTMSKQRELGEAALYRFGADRSLEEVISETTISNGLGWSPDRSRMYFVDSLAYRIDVLDYDPSSGAASARRPLVTIDPDDGLPDGLAVDSEGCIWLCLFGGGAIRRYGPGGELLEHVALPVTHPTCPAFGDEELTTIYVTSSSHKLTEAEQARQPQAGSIVALDAPVAGLPTGIVSIPA